MRVFLSKFKCLSICLSDKSSHRFESPSPLKLEDAQNSCSTSSSIVLEGQSTAATAATIDEIQKNELSTDGKVRISVKSCLKKSPASESEEEAKGRVKWMDFVGKELVEIREFESTDSGDSEDEDGGNQSCACFTQ